MNKHEKRLNILTAAVFLVLLYTLAVIFLLKPAQSFSEEENRNPVSYTHLLPMTAFFSRAVSSSG